MRATFLILTFLHIIFIVFIIVSKLTLDLQQSVFVTTSNQGQRVENIDTAVFACFIAILILITTPYWSLLPLAWIKNLAVIVVIVNYLFLYIVYGCNFWVISLPGGRWYFFEDLPGGFLFWGPPFKYPNLCM